MARPTNTSVQTRLVLAAFAAQPGVWRYGYDLCRETSIKPGTLYPMLLRLAEHRLLESEWRPSLKAGRPARHAYRLTEEGMALAVSSPVQAAGGRGKRAPVKPRSARA
ncbi:MAG: PadR family transcriptional regulator [Gammaproteobacteria bacterium]|nr:PadR family transcriptional regulator [Gammaproteobacteria bacterium]